MRTILLIIAFSLPALFHCGASAGELNSVKTNEHRVRFQTSAPYGKPAEIPRRFGYSNVVPTYDLSQEEFRVIIPENYSSNASWGLLVWVSPGNDAYIPPDWPAELARHRLLFVSAMNSGNNRHPIDRIRLALDATCNVCLSNKVDFKRIYIGGFSGGGRVASMMAVAYSDLFAGALCVCGVNFYQDLRAANNQGYPASYWPPTGLVMRSRERSRLVLLTGEHDQNRDNTKVCAENGFKAESFRNLLYIEVPGMKHAIPGAKELRKCLDYLDPLPAAP